MGSIRDWPAVGSVVGYAAVVEKYHLVCLGGQLRYRGLDGALPEISDIPVAVDVAGLVELVGEGSACGLDYGLGRFVDLEIHFAFAAAAAAFGAVAADIAAADVGVPIFPFAVAARVEAVAHLGDDWQLHCGS